jgi:hypothetical protein
VQVVGGGVLGLAIAQLILWWMPGQWDRANRDPLGLAETVSRHAPFLLPWQLRGDPADTTSFGGLAKTGGPGTAGGGGLSSRDGTRSVGENGDPDASDSLADEGDPAKRDWEPLGAATLAEGVGMTTEVPNVSPRLDFPHQPPPSKAVSPSPAPAAVAAPFIRNAVPVDASELPGRLEAAEKSQLAWDSAANPTLQEKVKLLENMYLTLARLGEATVFHPSSPDDPLDETMKRLARQPDKLLFLARYAARWLNEGHDREGVMLFGTVLSDVSNGKTSEMRIQLASKDQREVIVVRPSDSTALIPAQSKILILGAIVANPRENLNGYDGTSPYVTVPGYQLVVSP